MGTIYQLKCFMSKQEFVPVYYIRYGLVYNHYIAINIRNHEASVRTTVQTNHHLHSSLANTFYSNDGVCVQSDTP
jgi:hypothetical protein